MLFERRSKNQIPDIEPDNGVVYRRDRNPRQISSTNEQNQNDNSTPGQSGFSHSLEVNAHDTATHTHAHTLTASQLYMQPSQRTSILFQELCLSNRYLLHHLPGIQQIYQGLAPKHSGLEEISVHRCDIVLDK